VSVALQYLEAWLRGSGAVAINNLMEDTATAEIARAQLWQWIRHGTSTESGPVTLQRVRALLAEELGRHTGPGAWRDAAALLDALVSAQDFPEFLTLTAYQKVVSREP
jgi:malate synthase